MCVSMHVRERVRVCAHPLPVALIQSLCVSACVCVCARVCVQAALSSPSPSDGGPRQSPVWLGESRWLAPGWEQPPGCRHRRTMPLSRGPAPVPGPTPPHLGCLAGTPAAPSKLFASLGHGTPLYKRVFSGVPAMPAQLPPHARPRRRPHPAGDGG